MFKPKTVKFIIAFSVTCMLVVPVFASAQLIFSGNNICEYIKSIYDFGVRAAGILAVVAIMFGGVLYMQSGGNTEKVTSAKGIITGAIVGLIMVLASWVLFNTIAPNLLVCKITEIKTGGTTGGTTGGGTTSNVDICAGKTTFASKEECEKNKTDKEATCSQGKDGKYCATTCGNAESVVSRTGTAQGACVIGVHCAYFVSWALQGSGCGVEPWSNTTASGLEGKMKGLGYKLESIKSSSDIQKGDVVFYKNSGGRISHTAIGVGGGKVIHTLTTSSGCSELSGDKENNLYRGKPLECGKKANSISAFQGHEPGFPSDQVKNRFEKNSEGKYTRVQCITTTSADIKSLTIAKVYRKSQ